MSTLKRMNYGEIHDLLANQLDEIAKQKLTGKELDEEIKIGNAMTGIASCLINLGKLQLQGAKHFGKEDSTEALFLNQKND